MAVKNKENKIKLQKAGLWNLPTSEMTDEQYKELWGQFKASQPVPFGAGIPEAQQSTGKQIGFFDNLKQAIVDSPLFPDKNYKGESMSYVDAMKEMIGDTLFPDKSVQSGFGKGLIPNTGRQVTIFDEFKQAAKNDIDPFVKGVKSLEGKNIFREGVLHKKQGAFTLGEPPTEQEQEVEAMSQALAGTGKGILDGLDITPGSHIPEEDINYGKFSPSWAYRKNRLKDFTSNPNFHRALAEFAKAFDSTGEGAGTKLADASIGIQRSTIYDNALSMALAGEDIADLPLHLLTIEQRESIEDKVIDSERADITIEYYENQISNANMTDREKAAIDLKVAETNDPLKIVKASDALVKQFNSEIGDEFSATYGMQAGMTPLSPEFKQLKAEKFTANINRFDSFGTTFDVMKQMVPFAYQGLQAGDIFWDVDESGVYRLNKVAEDGNTLIDIRTFTAGE